MDSLTAKEFCDYLDEVEKSYEKYEKFIERRGGREIARIRAAGQCLYRVVLEDRSTVCFISCRCGWMNMRA
jgi:hypothetical protein